MYNPPFIHQRKERSCQLTEILYPPYIYDIVRLVRNPSTHGPNAPSSFYIPPPREIQTTPLPAIGKFLGLHLANIPGISNNHASVQDLLADRFHDPGGLYMGREEVS